MEFDKQYLNYPEYQGLGGTLAEMPFNLLEFQARKKIDERTFGRLVEKGNEYKEVKLCVYELIGTLNSYSQYNSQNKGITSESTDGYSVSYETPTKSISEARNSEIADIINSYLSTLEVNGTLVLWRGTNDN